MPQTDPDAIVQSIRPDRRCWVLPILRAIEEMGGQGGPEVVKAKVLSFFEQSPANEEEHGDMRARALRRAPVAMAESGLLEVVEGSWVLTPLARDYLRAHRKDLLVVPGLVSARRATPGQPAAEIAIPVRALSLRQPWAELVMRGVKTIEVRSVRTKVRGAVQIYAGKKSIDSGMAASVSKVYGLDIDTLPRGVLVGTVRIVDSRPLTFGDSSRAGFTIEQIEKKFAWILEQPRRFQELRAPERQPQPTFFFPFGKPES